MAEVRVLPAAIRDLDRLDDFLREKNPGAADQVLLLIDRALHRLARFPSLGRPLDDHPGFKELYLPFGASAYALRYQRVGQAVIVVRIWHSKESRT